MKLNFEEVFKSQKLLDESILKVHKIEFNKETVDKQIIALIVELAEFSNEIKTFKYWKKDQKRDEQKVLEEYADVLHFFISFALRTNVPSQIEVPEYSGDINQNILKIFNYINEFQVNRDNEKLLKAFVLFLSIAQWLGYDYDEIIKSYYEKLQINFERIKNNY